MNPVCASCKKTVYPMEKLNCLDKFWHKGCFRCSTCSMTLNMKNYKGYDKMPYCAAHYPTTKFTAVADTPENLRLKQNTNNQSILTYHADYEKMKGTKQTIADDLETLRASKSAQIASEVSYRGVKVHRDEQEMHRPEQAIDDERRNPRNRAVGRISDYDPAETHPSPYSARSQMPTIYDSNKGGRVAEDGSGGRKVGKISDYDPDHNQWGTISQGYEERVPGRFEPVNQYNPPSQPASQPGYYQGGQQPQQPTHHTWQPPSMVRKQQQPQQQQQPVPQQAYGYGMQPTYGQQGYRQPGMYQPPAPSSQQGYQPPPNQPTSPSWNPQPAPGYGQIFNKPGQGQWQPQRSQGQSQGFRQVQPGFGRKGPPQNPSYVPVPPQGPVPKAAGPGYRAIYDYTAADEDEISFVEGDIIKDVTVIDDGWMEGRNARTGQYGMLPSNYVERV